MSVENPIPVVPDGARLSRRDLFALGARKVQETIERAPVAAFALTTVGVLGGCSSPNDSPEVRQRRESERCICLGTPLMAAVIILIAMNGRGENGSENWIMEKFHSLPTRTQFIIAVGIAIPTAWVLDKCVVKPFLRATVNP